MTLEKKTNRPVYLYLPNHLTTEEPWKTYLEGLIGTKILQTGVNIEEITHFINARGMKSEIATLQALGRALRKHNTKDKVYVYDFFDQEKYLVDHSIEREKHYREEGHEVIKI